jgi:ribosomal protein S18 acetylase RimI-like enzyme
MRPITTNDLTDLKEVINSNELFPTALLDEMTADFFNNENSNDIWLTEESNHHPIAVVYCAPERMTEGTYNLFLIAIHKEYQGLGVGSKLMTQIEELLANMGARILIVETSALPSFELTRKFYLKLGYQKEAVIREFYQEGEDKIVFWKKLSK